MRALSTFLFSILFVGFVYSQEIVTDRPDQTESSSTVPKNNFQIESGVSVEIDENDDKVINTAIPSTLFRLGVLDWLELRLVSQFEINSTRNLDITSRKLGISDLELGFKVQCFQKEEVNFEMAFLSHLLIPSGSLEFTNEKVGVINKLSIAHELGNKFGVGYNLGYDYLGRDKGSFTNSLALGYSVTDKLGIYIEPYGEWENFENYIANFDAGMTYLLKPNLQLDFSFGTGLNHDMNYVALGFSWSTFKGE